MKSVAEALPAGVKPPILLATNDLEMCLYDTNTGGRAQPGVQNCPNSAQVSENVWMFAELRISVDVECEFAAINHLPTQKWLKMLIRLSLLVREFETDM